MNAVKSGENPEIVSNNPLVSAEFAAAHGMVVHEVAGTLVDVLGRLEELLQDGRRLVSTPLPPNIPLMRAPFRSVLVEKNAASRKYDAEGLISLAKAKERVLAQSKNAAPLSEMGSELEKDFAVIDREMLLRALRDAGLCAALDAPASHSRIP
jgi:hypothetical protein